MLVCSIVVLVIIIRVVSIRVIRVVRIVVIVVIRVVIRFCIIIANIFGIRCFLVIVCESMFGSMFVIIVYWSYCDS